MKKFAKINMVLMLGVVFISLFQSLHTFSHKYFKETHTHNAPITDENRGFVIHQGHENCSICDFNFGFFVSPSYFSLRLYTPHFKIPYYFSSQTTEIYFSGASFVRRGPPITV